MKWIMIKQVDAIRVTQERAKIDYGLDINNLTHGTDGYIVNGKKWIPRELFEAQAVPYDSEAEVTKVMRTDITRHIQWLQEHYLQHHTSKIATEPINVLENYKNKLINLQKIISAYGKSSKTR